MSLFVSSFYVLVCVPVLILGLVLVLVLVVVFDDTCCLDCYSACGIKEGSVYTGFLCDPVMESIPFARQ